MSIWRKSSAERVAPVHLPKVGEPGRMSTATSKISPCRVRISLPCGRRSCACRPRSVPRSERDWLSWTKECGMPASRYLRSWKVSRKCPRASRNTSGSMSRTPGRSVFNRRMVDGHLRSGRESSFESVAVAADGEEVARLLGVALQLHAQRPDEVVDRARSALVFRTPAAGQDVVAAEGPAAGLEEEPQHLELLRGHLDVRAVPGDGLRAEVRLDLAEADAVRRPLVARRPAAQERLDPREQLAQAERLGEVVVGAQLEPQDLEI